MKNKENGKNKWIGTTLSVTLLIIAIMSIIAEANGPPIGQYLNLSVGGDMYGKTGDNVKIYVNVTNADNISRLQFDLLFDQNVLNVTNVTNGSVVLSDFHTTVNNGDINIVIGPPDNTHGNPFDILRISGDGTVAIINFTVVGTDGSASYLDLNNVKVKLVKNDDKIKVVPNITNSMFYVDNIPPVVNSITLDNYNPITGQNINVSVNATDNNKVAIVEANGTMLSYQGGNIWNGSITAMDGIHSVNVSAIDVAGNIGWNNSTSYIAKNGGQDQIIIGGPEITKFVPGTLWVNDSVGAIRTYRIEINQTVNVTWYIRPIGDPLSSKYIVLVEHNVENSSYTNDSAVEGIWRVTVSVRNANGNDSHVWNWNVSGIGPTPTVIVDPSPTATATVTSTATPDITATTSPTVTSTATPDITATTSPTVTTTEPSPTATVPSPTVTTTEPSPTVTTTEPSPTATVPSPTVTATEPSPIVTVPSPTPTTTPEPTVPTVTRPSGGSGGGSGEGFDHSKIIGEPDIFEERLADLRAGISSTYSFNIYDFAIYEVAVVDKENEYKVAIRVTKIKDSTKFTKEDMSEAVFTNESVTSESQRLSNVIIRFKVNNSWINSGGIDNVRLYKLVNGSWSLLDTVLKNNDGKYTYFESKDSAIARWQLFAISGTKNPPPKLATPLPTMTGISNSDKPIVSDKGDPIPILVLIILVILATVGYYLYRRGNKNEEKKE